MCVLFKFLILLVLLQTQSQVEPIPSFRQAGDVAIITIEGPVDSITSQSFRRRLLEAKDADAIVIDLKTPGGDLMSTLEICYEIKNNAPQNTVAWIHPHAFSAGTIIALACREIVISTGGMFGDAAPINATGAPIPATERAKIESPVLAEVIDSARRNHYDERLVEAFVSVGVELWLIQNQKTSEIICVNAIEFESIFGESPPRSFTPIGTSEQSTQLSPFFKAISEFGNQEDPTENWDPLFLQELPSSRIALNATDASDWGLVEQIVPNDRLLTLTPNEGVKYGLISSTIDDDQALKEWFGANTLTRSNPNWSENLVGVLISWPVRLALIALFLICIVVEFTTGSSGIFGFAATICMAILMGAPWIAGLAQWWDLLFILIGLLLIACEVMIVPGTGFTGFSGVAFLFAGMVGSFVSGDLSSVDGQTQLVTGLATVMGGVCIAMVLSWYLVRQFGDARAFRRIILENEINSQTTTKRITELEVGTVAIALTDLRPSGKIQVGETVYDVTTTGSWVTEGKKVRIMETGMNIEVEELT